MIMKSFLPNSFVALDMPGEYTICVDPSIPQVQHAHRNVPIKADPRKSDGTICHCLDSCDLNKAIIREHYKAPALDKISHRLSSTTVFSKLDVKDGFWSIHLNTPSSYLATFNTHKGHYQYLCVPF